MPALPSSLCAAKSVADLVASIFAVFRRGFSRTAGYLFFVKLTFKFQHLLKEFDFQTSTGYETLQPVMARIVWSMRLVAARFMITEISGDWKYLRQLFNFSTHWNGLHICHFCRVRKTEYADLSMPEWRTTREFLLEVLPGTPSPLILLPCFDVSMIQICQLHSLNLGLLWTCNGSTICYLMEAGMFGDPRLGLHELLERVHSDFLIWATENRIAVWGLLHDQGAQLSDHHRVLDPLLFDNMGTTTPGCGPDSGAVASQSGQTPR